MSRSKGREPGLCNSCGREPPEPGRVRCTACLASRRSGGDRRARRYREAGLCPRDGNPLAPGRAVCAGCLDRHSARQRARYQELQGDGRCHRCGRDPDRVDPRFLRSPSCSQCPPCFFSDSSRSHFRTRSFGAALMAMFLAQGGRCALTGRDLILGDNTSLDHRVPKSRGGANDVTNVQWTCRAANQGKGRMTNDEYIEECRRVVAYGESPEYARVQRRLKKCCGPRRGGP